MDGSDSSLHRRGGGQLWLAKTAQSAVNDLKKVLERAAYVICNTDIFARVPQNEADVHDRLEAILKCHYPDLKRKPRLNKPIKSFEPDTGITSAKTLLEYKFITTLDEAKKAVEQILADASGYRSREWTNLLFVIYETKRVVPVDDWRSLLNDCDLLEGFDVVVLPGADLDAA